MNIYEEWAALKSQEREIQAQMEEIKSRILDTMTSEGIQAKTTSLGTISITKRNNYNYPDWFLQTEDQYKLDRKRAQKEADVSITEGLLFKPLQEVVEPQKGRIH